MRKIIHQTHTNPTQTQRAKRFCSRQCKTFAFFFLFDRLSCTLDVFYIIQKKKLYMSGIPPSLQSCDEWNKEKLRYRSTVYTSTTLTSIFTYYFFNFSMPRARWARGSENADTFLKSVNINFCKNRIRATADQLKSRVIYEGTRHK